ncbi:MAG: glycosyltransferase family 4 protein, partial [Phycisphaerales bacterium]|nr:glycosyltransferase family 4 protein [Phycisphaerales bacterium]
MLRISVCMFLRRSLPGYFSVERLFESVRSHLPADISCTTHVCSRLGVGILPRVWIAIEAAFRQSQVNHVTGDVNFLTMLMRRKATILTVHDLVTLDRLKGFRRWLFRLLWFRLPISRTHVVTVVSAATRDRLLQELGPIRREVRVIHNPLMDGY